MNKPSTDPLSDLVRTCPQASQKVPRGEESRGEKNPLTPASGGTLGRADRARRGSRRQRDLEALAAEQAATLAALTPTPAAEQAWSAVLERAEASPAIRPDSIETWMRPARVAGVDGDTLVLAVPARAVYWLEHRYHGWIAMALRSCSEFFAVRVIEEPGEVAR